MGKKLIIKGANFAQNAIDTTFNPYNWFINTIDEQCRNIPLGYAVAYESNTNTPRSQVGMISPNTTQGQLYFGPLKGGLQDPRFSTRQAVSLKTLYDNGYSSLKLTPKVTGNIVVLYSDTPTTSSTNPYEAGKMSYNNSTAQVTIPITANTYIFFQAKSITGDTSITSGTITDWLNISIE